MLIMPSWLGLIWDKRNLNFGLHRNNSPVACTSLILQQTWLLSLEVLRNLVCSLPCQQALPLKTHSKASVTVTTQATRWIFKLIYHCINDRYEVMPRKKKKGEGGRDCLWNLCSLVFSLDLKMSWKVEKLAHSKYLLVTIFFFYLFKAYAILQGRHQEREIPSPLAPEVTLLSRPAGALCSAYSQPLLPERWKQLFPLYKPWTTFEILFSKVAVTSCSSVPQAHCPFHKISLGMTQSLQDPLFRGRKCFSWKPPGGRENGPVPAAEAIPWAGEFRLEAEMDAPFERLFISCKPLI